MSIESSDFAFVYSGGSTNDNPSFSLGGEPSAYPIPGSINNLFSDIDPNQADNGFTDFRCFFIFNDNETDALYDAQALIQNQITDGSVVQIGFFQQNDKQAITIQGSPTHGSMTLLYELYQAIITYHPDPNVLAANVEDVLNSTGHLSTVQCNGFLDNGAITVIVNFQGKDGNRYQPELTVLTNNIEGSTGIIVTKIQDGSPVNAIPSTIQEITAAPPGVFFDNYSVTEPFTIGTIYPGDGFAVWVQRTTPANADGVHGDGFTFRLMGEPNPTNLAPPPPTFRYTATGGISLEGNSVDKLLGPGVYETEMSGGINVNGFAGTSYEIDGIPHFFYDMTGGAIVSGISVSKYFPWFQYKMSGGIQVSNPNSVAETSTTGIDFVSKCSDYGGCEQFPISWEVTLFGNPVYIRCNVEYLSQSSRLDYDDTTCSWRGTIGNGDPSNHGRIWYFELTFNLGPQTWEFKSHTPPQAGDIGQPEDCILVDVIWEKNKWNCCAENSLANGIIISEDFRDLQLYLIPVEYCTPAPCQYYCGKCCQYFKCPPSYIFTTYFQVGSSCYESALHGQFTLNYAPNLILTAATYQTGACAWLGEITGGSVPCSWIMQFDPTENTWFAFVYDPTLTYIMEWQISDRDFLCCGVSLWTLTPGQGICEDSDSNVAATYAANPADCQ